MASCHTIGKWLRTSATTTGTKTSLKAITRYSLCKQITGYAS